VGKEELISSLISSGFLRGSAVIAAFRKVRREDFLPEEYRRYAYDDSPLPIGGGQTISAPHMVAVMTELLGVKDGQRILEVGAGSGYQAAILSALNPGGRIFTVEIMDAVAMAAAERLKGYKNVSLIVGDGSLGLPQEAPFDRIIATAGCPAIPLPWKQQLAEGGLILAPVGGLYSQDLVLARKEHGVVSETNANFPCVFVPLRGKYGWQ
jgi:protein-L-isoaspartate(D-aspartate) O-methyltransferase